MCKHIFIGNAEGVKCSLCGIEMTPSEYLSYDPKKDAEKAENALVSEAPKAPSRRTKKK